MNIDFEAALQYIDLGSYEKAIDKLKSAISKETEKGDITTATEYRCVLGELYANLHMIEESTDEFNQVLDFCDENFTLQKQREIAQTYIDIFNGKVPASLANERVKRLGDVPLVPKPRQDTAFIAKQSRKHK